MTQPSSQSSTTRGIGVRVAELRARRGWSARELAEECARRGAPSLNRNVLANLESGRRPAVTVDELLTLAYVLDVAPVHLLVPTDPGGENFHVTADLTMPPVDARAWVRGELCPPGADPRRFYSTVPREEYEQWRTEMEDVDRQFRGPGLPVTFLAPRQED